MKAVGTGRVENQLKIHCWEEESIAYNKESGDMHLLSSFNARLLLAMRKKNEKQQLVKQITEGLQIDIQEAEVFLDNLYLEYQKLNLID